MDTKALNEIQTHFSHSDPANCSFTLKCKDIKYKYNSVFFISTSLLTVISLKQLLLEKMWFQVCFSINIHIPKAKKGPSLLESLHQSLKGNVCGRVEMVLCHLIFYPLTERSESIWVMPLNLLIRVNPTELTVPRAQCVK